MRHYTHLTLEQRYQIQALLKMGHPYQEIATVVGVHKSTISREVRRNQGRRGYRPQQAHRFTLTRRRTKVRRRIPADMWHCVNRLLQEEWSPEEISGWLRICQGHSVSPEGIYQQTCLSRQTLPWKPVPEFAVSAATPQTVRNLQSSWPPPQPHLHSTPSSECRTSHAAR